MGVSFVCMMLDIISSVKMHMFMFFVIVRTLSIIYWTEGCCAYFVLGWDQRWKNISSIVAVLSVMPSQLNIGLFNNLDLSIWSIKKPPFLEWMCKSLSKNDNSWTCKGFVNIIAFGMIMVSNIQHMGHLRILFNSCSISCTSALRFLLHWLCILTNTCWQVHMEYIMVQWKYLNHLCFDLI